MRKVALVVLCSAMLLSLPHPAQPAPAPEPEPPKVVRVDMPGLQLLARVIYTEARGEPFAGQVAVGAVAVNRMRDPRWPDKLEDVLLEPDQFAPPTGCNEQTLWAAKLAVLGVDPTQGATYFYAPDKATDRWIFTRETVCEIGGHRFAR